MNTFRRNSFKLKDLAGFSLQATENKRPSYRGVGVNQRRICSQLIQSPMPSLDQVLESYGARITIRRPGAPDPKGKCVVHWMQRAQRSRDNHALDVAIDVANALNLPV